MNGLSQKQSRIHNEIVSSVERHRKLEWKIIQLLQEAEEVKLPRAFECGSLFKYATKVLKLEEDRAYPLITLARKTKSISQLADALCEGRLSVSKASRIVSIIDSNNADELIKFAMTHSKREVEFEVARRNPRAAIERVKPISEDRVELTISLSKADYEKLLRVQSLEARRHAQVSRGEAVSASLDAYLFRHDPVAKADRSAQRNQSRQKVTVIEHDRLLSRESDAAAVVPTSQGISNHLTKKAPASIIQADGKELCPGRVNRRPLTAAQRHATHLVTRGKCTHIHPDGSRCDEDRYTETHHIIEVSRGGSNHPGNLTTLCRFHHQLLHKKTHELPNFEDWIEQCLPTEVYF
jgi:hypothetical protein